MLDDHLPITPYGRVEEVWEDKDSLRPCMNPCLEEEYEKDINYLLDSFSDVFSEIPGCTSTVAHDNVLTTSESLKPKRYPVLIHLQSHFEKEVL